MRSYGTVSSAYVMTLLDTARQYGIKLGNYLNSVGMTRNQLRVPNGRIAAEKLIRLFSELSRDQADPDIGLHMGENVRPGTFSALGYAAMSSQTLGEALKLIPRFERLVYEYGSTQIRQQQGMTYLCWNPIDVSLTYERHAIDSILAGWLTFGRWITGFHGPLRAVQVQYSEPKDTRELRRVFNCPIAFGADLNAVIFDTELGSLPLLQADEEVFGLMEQQAAKLLKNIRGGTDIRLLVKDQLYKLLPHGEPRISHVSEALNISPRTLQRKLKDQGTTFQNVLYELRRDLAHIYLKDRQLSLLEVSMLLGFSEQSSFSHAFKTWFGEPPLRYRRSHAA